MTQVSKETNVSLQKTLNGSNINTVELEIMRTLIKNDEKIQILGSCE